MMRSMALVLAAVLPSALQAGANEWSLLERIYGPPSLSVYTGNGRLTVGLDHRGRLSTCRWPAPSFHDQLSYSTAADAAGRGLVGVALGVSTEEGVSFLYEDRWRVSTRYATAKSHMIETVAQDTLSAARVRHTWMVDPERDVLALHVELEDFEHEPKLVLFANFTPCTRKLEGLAVADTSAFDDANDFAAFSSQAGRTYHFRPSAASSDDWRMAEDMVSAPTEQWPSRFKSGAWIGYTANNPIIARHVGSGDAAPEIVAKRFLAPGAGSPAAVGETYSIMSLEPRVNHERYEVEVFFAFGNSQEAVDAELDAARTASASSLLRDRTIRHHERWLSSATLPTTDPDTAALMQRALLLLNAATDKESGAVVRSPAVQPPLARDWLRHGAWVTLAYSLTGYRQLSEQRLRFYLDQVQREPRPGRPLGSLPASLYGDGTPASPDFVLDTQAVGWTLWSVRRYCERLDPAAGKAFVTSAWKELELAGDFIAGWTDGQNHPRHSFDPNQMHDARNRGDLVAAHAGLTAVMALAQNLGIEMPPSWQRQKAAFDVLLQSIFLTGDGDWPIDEPLPVSLGEIPNVDPADVERLLGGLLSARMAQLNSLDRFTAAAAFANAAVIFESLPERLAGLRPHVQSLLQRAVDVSQQGPDTAAAAMALAGAIIVLSGESNAATSQPAP